MAKVCAACGAGVELFDYCSWGCERSDLAAKLANAESALAAVRGERDAMGRDMERAVEKLKKEMQARPRLSGKLTKCRVDRGWWVATVEGGATPETARRILEQAQIFGAFLEAETVDTATKAPATDHPGLERGITGAPGRTRGEEPRASWPSDEVVPAAVVIESPFLNGAPFAVLYARLAMRDQLRRGAAPFASHLLYPQVLEDADQEQRRRGIAAGWLPYRYGATAAVYVDFGITEGMAEGIEQAQLHGCPVVFYAFGSHLRDQVVTAAQGGALTPQGYMNAEAQVVTWPEVLDCGTLCRDADCMAQRVRPSQFCERHAR